MGGGRKRAKSGNARVRSTYRVRISAKEGTTPLCDEFRRERKQELPWRGCSSGITACKKKKKNRAQGRRDITGCWIGTPPEAIYSFERFFFHIHLFVFSLYSGLFLYVCWDNQKHPNALFSSLSSHTKETREPQQSTPTACEVELEREWRTTSQKNAHMVHHSSPTRGGLLPHHFLITPPEKYPTSDALDRTRGIGNRGRFFRAQPQPIDVDRL